MSDKIIPNSEDILNMVDTDKILNDTKKKRGRPKKNNQYNLTNMPKIKLSVNEFHNYEDDEIILHLPISKSDILSLKNNDKTLEDLNEKIVNLSVNENKNETNDEFDENLELSYYYAKQYNSIIKKLKEDNNKLINFLEEITPMYNTEVKFYPINLNLFELNNSKLIPKKTNIACWWCTYQFDNLPTFLPEKIHNGDFYVQGCFCSFNCTAAYNLNMNDTKLWERYSLLKQLYYLINKDIIKSIVDIEINIAGPKELLEKYGGMMTIEEYRKNSKILGREYKKLIPPFIPSSYGFEETTISKISTKNINVNNILNSKSKSENVIKRTKPITNIASSTIDEYIE